ncbi:MAG TPA: DEAD/DEAH box helicase family protein [Candidatus Peribacterales bacterium]|nr:DEAD/DEAH box helicase family protein [Candidatus Peribacterales bacterium]
MPTEADARIAIDRKLRESGWILEGEGKNVLTEQSSEAGSADYLLLDRNGRNLAVIEAKKDSIDPYFAKDQARGYAEAKNCRYVFLANSEQIYFWDLEQADAQPIEKFYSPEDLQRRDDMRGLRKPLSVIEHNTEIASRTYQKKASDLIAKQYDEGKRKFLLEMATGTGKTRLAAALIERFLRAQQAERILFIVDRIELRKQAFGVFQDQFRQKYSVANYKPGQHGAWGGANVVVATIQSLNIHYKEDFTPGYFDVIFNDECHRSIYGELPREVMEYFQATNIGLTATPRDFLKNIDVDDLLSENPKQLEARIMRDTYKYFGCEDGNPTYRYSIQDAVTDKYLVPAKIYRMLSLITKESVSDIGWNTEIDGEDYTFKIGQLEKKVIIPKRNELLCRQFLENALRAPDGSIGKTIVFAVSQNHAVRLTQIFNEMMPESNGRFAEVITSRVKNASELAKQFRNSECYWPRIAVSVDMLSTGYDCPEVLNIVLARPIASPVTYIQIKGRGTRLHTFKDANDKIIGEKTEFLIHDFCEVVEYFEEKYDFEAPLPAPTGNGAESEDVPQAELGETAPIGEGASGRVTLRTPVVSPAPDLKDFSEIIEVGPDGEKVDRMLYQEKWQQAIQRVAAEKPQIVAEAKEGELSDELMEYLQSEVLDKPREYFNERNLSRVYKVLAGLTDFVKAALGVEQLPTVEEQLDRLVTALTAKLSLNLQQVKLLRILVEQLSASPQYARAFESGQYTFLDNAPFSRYGGSDAYLRQFGGTQMKELFDTIRQSPPLRLMLLS